MIIFLTINFFIFTYVKSEESQNDISNFSLPLEIFNQVKEKSINLSNYNITKNLFDTDKNNFSKFQIKTLLKLNLTDFNFLTILKSELKNLNNSNILHKNKYTPVHNYSKISYLGKISIKDFHKKKYKIRNLLSNFKCTDNSSCNYHGRCTDDKKNCTCDYGFLTNQEIIDFNNTFCNYEQKKQLNAFLFELFLGFGAGHFYTLRYTHAALKLSAFIFGIFIMCLFPLTAKCLSEKLESDCLVLTASCFYYLCSIGLAYWFIYDLVQFGMNSYLDGYGLELLSWSKNKIF